MPIDLTTSPTEPLIEAHTVSVPARAIKWAESALLLIASVFLALHFVHLKADFPNHSPWMDWAKYTDEGWYGDAAIRHYEFGHWNEPGDFNPAAALPVWPLLEMVLFRFTGVSLAAARALTVTIFGFTLLCSYGLIRRWSHGWNGASLAPAFAVLLLAVNPFCFAFSRLAILEPLLVLEALVALVVASEAGAVSVRRCGAERPSSIERRQLGVRFLTWSTVLGLLLPLMVLTKTTGICLFPAILWLLWASAGYQLRPFLRAAAVAGGVGAAAWGAYFGFFVRPRYLMDYRYLFSANAYTGVTGSTFWSLVGDALTDGSWIGITLFWLALAGSVGWLVHLSGTRLRGNPLAASLLLWVGGYWVFLTYHANLQPRYYEVIATPLVVLAAMACDAVLARAWQSRGSGAGVWLLRVTAVATGGALVYVAIGGAWRTVAFVRHPEYTFLSASNQVNEVVQRQRAIDPGHSALVLSISGSDLSLMTGLHSICDDFGTMTLPDRLAAYKPGWYASWNDVEDDKMEAMAPMYRLVRVAAFPALDDPERNLLILYRLDLIGTPGPKGRPGRRRSLTVPHRLRTRVGEQPTPQQLRH